MTPNTTQILFLNITEKEIVHRFPYKKAVNVRSARIARHERAKARRLWRRTADLAGLGACVPDQYAQTMWPDIRFDRGPAQYRVEG